jgi:quinol monooxygenase YgiN
MTQTALFVKLVALPGKRDEVLGILEDNLVAAQEEEGTLVYAFHYDARNEDVLWVYELYSDRDAMTVHTQSDIFTAGFPKLQELLAEPLAANMVIPTAKGKGFPA